MKKILEMINERFDWKDKEDFYFNLLDKEEDFDFTHDLISVSRDTVTWETLAVKYETPIIVLKWKAKTLGLYYDDKEFYKLVYSQPYYKEELKEKALQKRNSRRF